MHKKNLKSCSKIECLMIQKALAPNILTSTVYIYIYIYLYIYIYIVFVVQWVRARICEVINFTYVCSSPLPYQDYTACHISCTERLERCHWRVLNTDL